MSFFIGIISGGVVFGKVKPVFLHRKDVASLLALPASGA
jgi:hypothetical protein